MTCAPSHLIPEKNIGGRPREYDRMKIVNDFIQYAKTHPDCLTVPCFTSTIGINSQMMNHWANEDEGFRLAFIEGKELIGLNRLKAVSANLLERSMYSQVVGNFDSDINIYQRAEKKFESSLKQQEHAVVSEADAKKLDAFVKQVSDAQVSSLARKMEASKSNADAKS